MLEKVGFNYKGKNVNIDVHKCSRFGTAFGLMFNRREKARALLFDFGKSVNWRLHSIFVFFPFVAVWLDDENKVVEIKKVNPFKFNVFLKKPFVKVVEIPINRKYEGVVSNLVGDTKSL